MIKTTKIKEGKKIRLLDKREKPQRHKEHKGLEVISTLLPL
jgi:hypothetical protein